MTGRADPLTAVDRVRSTGASGFAATKAVTADDPYLPGHFPGNPVYPGVFVAETVLQAARLHLRRPHARISSLDVLRLHRPLPAGAVLHVSAVLTGQVVRATVIDDTGRRAATVTLTLTLTNPAVEPVEPVEPVGPVGPPGSAPDPAAGRIAVPAAALTVGPGRPPSTGLLAPGSVLPHAAPALLLDRVLTLRPGRRVVAEHTVAPDAPCFRGAAAGADYPETLVLESFAQCAALLVLHGRPAAAVALGSVRGARVLAPVPAGATLRHEVRVRRLLSDTVVVSGTTLVDGRPCLVVDDLVAAVRSELGREAACTT